MIPVMLLSSAASSAAALCAYCRVPRAQGAADRSELNRRVFLRLNLGLLGLAGAAGGLLAGHAPALAPAALALGAAASLPALGVAAGHYARSSGHGLNPGPVLAARSACRQHAALSSRALGSRKCLIRRVWHSDSGGCDPVRYRGWNVQVSLSQVLACTGHPAMRRSAATCALMRAQGLAAEARELFHIRRHNRRGAALTYAALTAALAGAGACALLAPDAALTVGRSGRPLAPAVVLTPAHCWP
jgi:hypothetical protein